MDFFIDNTFEYSYTYIFCFVTLFYALIKSQSTSSISSQSTSSIPSQSTSSIVGPPAIPASAMPAPAMPAPPMPAPGFKSCWL